MAMAQTKKTGTYEGKSNRLGYGGRAEQLRDQGVPEGVIGAPVRPYASEAITDAWQEYREAVDGASEKLLAALAPSK